MTLSTDSFIASLVSTSQSEEKQSKPRTKLAQVKAAKAAAPKVTEGEIPSEVCGPLPEKGSLSAVQFMAAQRSVRYVDPEGKIRTRAPSRHELMCAIAGFIGYDGRDNFGPQLSRALNAAQRDIMGPCAVPDWKDTRNALRSVEGYVSGMGDAATKTLLDLLSREKEAVDNMIAQEKIVNDPSKAEQDRTLASNFVKLETDRLAQIREQIGPMSALASMSLRDRKRYENRAEVSALRLQEGDIMRDISASLAIASDTSKDARERDAAEQNARDWGRALQMVRHQLASLGEGPMG